MGSHFSAIGLPRSFNEAHVEQLAALRRRVAGAGPGIEFVEYDDPSGSRVTMTFNNGAISCLTPGVRPGPVIEAIFNRLAEDNCPYELPAVISVLEDGDEVYPLAIQVDDLAISAGRFVTPRRAMFEIAGLAETISFYPGEAAYRASGTPMSARSLIPSGLFAPGPQAADTQFETLPRALISGEVTAARLVRHSLFGEQFARLSVASYGADYEIAVAVSDLPTAGGSAALPAPGSIVSGQIWLSGRMVEGSA